MIFWLKNYIAGLSGAFVYSSSNNVYVYANSSSIGVYNASEQKAVIKLRQNGIYKDLICGDTYVCENNTLNLPKKDINAFLLIKTED